MPATPRVLLVDDEELVLSALRRTLRREPYEIEVATNGTRALERLGLDPPFDLVISDYKMPGMTGLELLTRVRSTFGETRRILLSGWVSELSKVEIAAAGLHATLSKPWDDAELKSTIRQALGLGT
jgi:CheY-like chemotaxis protein